MGGVADKVRRGPASTLRTFLAAAAVFLSAPASAVIPLPPETGRFLALSDIHFDPFADPAIVPGLIAADADRWPALFASSKVKTPVLSGADTNYPLLDSTLEAAAQEAGGEGYDFVLLTGDLLRHDFEDEFAKYGGGDKAALEAFTRKTMAFVNGE